MNIIWRFDVFIFFTVRDRFDSVLDMYMSVIQCCWLLSEEWVASVSSQSLQIAAYNGSHSTIDHSIPIQNKSTIIIFDQSHLGARWGLGIEASDTVCEQHNVDVCARIAAAFSSSARRICRKIGEKK